MFVIAQSAVNFPRLSVYENYYFLCPMVLVCFRFRIADNRPFPLHTYFIVFLTAGFGKRSDDLLLPEVIIKQSALDCCT